MKKKLLAFLLIGVLGTSVLAACGGNQATSETASSVSESAEEEPAATPEPTEEPVEEEPAEEPAAAVDKELLVVSFGTSYNDSRNVTIGGIENALREAYPNFLVRRAFTAQIIIDKLAERDGIHIDNVTEALDRAVADGIKTLVVQPTHLMNGFEYTDLKDELDAYADSFESLVLAEPLLTSDEDFTAVAESLHSEMEQYDDGKTAIVFMGHGTEAESNSVYGTMQEKFTELGYNNFYVGTVEAAPTCEDVLAAIEGKGYEKVVLRAMMVVAGDHANNDMADPEDPESWYSQFTNAGYQVETVLEGLGQIYDIQQLYVDHTTTAMDSIGEAADQSVAVNTITDGDPTKAILVTSFGTSYNDSRNITIGGIENVLRENFEGYQIRRAFTAQIIIDKLAERDGIVIDNFEQAMDRAVADGIQELIIVPTHLMNGFEYTDVMDAMADYEDKFEVLAISDPLLTSDDDYTRVAEALYGSMEKYDDGETAIVFMGHGTEAESNSVYATMQEKFTELGKENVFVGTVEAEPTLEDVLAKVKEKNYSKVVLRAMMVVAGDHANNDMADPEDPESWYSAFTAEGYDVTAVLQGLGQIYEVAEIYAEHAEAKMG